MTQLQVRDVLHAHVHTITPTTLLPNIEQQMQALDVRRLPVLERGTLVGIVTRGDVRYACPSDVPQLRAYEHPKFGNAVNARSMMSRPVISISATAPLSDAARLMFDHKISSLPVLRRGRLVGMITADDIFRTIAETLSPLGTAPDLVDETNPQNP